jgi:pimeloyl-ACP methyl ester carboxylesterase
VAPPRPQLAEDFTVVATDLRGYGDSSKRETTPDHAPYSKRTMAEDQLEVMRHFGFERFALCGHYLPEEAPEETHLELHAYFDARG